VLEVLDSNPFGDYAFSGSHVGSWRIPELKSDELPGQVSFDETGRITLELLGSFEPDPQQPPHLGHEYPPITGRDNYNACYWLFGCQATDWQFATGGDVAGVTLRAERALMSPHVPSVEDLKVLAIQFRSPRLADWWIAPGVHARRETKLVIRTQSTPDPVSLGVWGDASLDLACQSVISYSQRGVQPVDTTRDMYLEVAGASDHSLEYYLHLLEIACTFAAIALQGLVDAPSISAYLDGGGVELEPGKLTYMGWPVLWPLRGCMKQGSTSRSRRLLCVESQADLIARMLSKWYADYERLEPITDVLLNSFQGPRLPRRQRFLASVSALEGLHRMAYPEPPWSPEDWGKRIDSIINSSAPKKVQRWARGLLKDHNEPSLPERLRQLCDDCTAFFGLNRTKRDDFVKETGKLRNEFAHSLPQSASGRSDVRRLDLRTRQAEALLLVSLFKYLGWTDADSAPRMSPLNLPEWQDIRKVFES